MQQAPQSACTISIIKYFWHASTLAKMSDMQMKIKTDTEPSVDDDQYKS